MSSVFVYGYGEQAFATRELAEKWREVDTLLNDGENWGNQIHELQVQTELPKVTRKFALYNDGQVYDFYQVEGTDNLGITRDLFDSYEEAVAAAPALRQKWIEQAVKSRAEVEDEVRKQADEKFGRLKEAGVVS